MWLAACGTLAYYPTSKPDFDDTSESGSPESAAAVDSARAWNEWSHLEGGTVDGAWSGGRLGTIWVELRTGVVACELLGDWVLSGEEAPVCEQCDWAFHLTVEESRLEGRCAALALEGAREGRWDGFASAWGWATDYHDARYGVDFSAALLVYYEEHWFPWAYEYGEEDGFAGDAGSFVVDSWWDVYYRP